MTNEELKGHAEEIFFQMLNLLLSVNKIANVIEPEKCIVAHTALANLVGAYFAGVARENGFPNDAVSIAMNQFFEHAKESFCYWRKNCQSGLM